MFRNPRLLLLAFVLAAVVVLVALLACKSVAGDYQAALAEPERIR